MKRHGDAIKKDNFFNLVVFGDLSSLPLDHFTSLVESVSCTCVIYIGSLIITTLSCQFMGEIEIKENIK